MKLLVVTQYFWPEGFVINDVVNELIRQGHEVMIATGKPNYPEGRVFDGYRAGGVDREMYAGAVNVVRIPTFPRGKGGALRLTLNYLAFVLGGLVYFPWLLRKQSFDTILVFAPSPITQIIPAILLKWLKRARLAVWVQDLWPESLAATGFVQNKKLLTLIGHGVRALYSASDILLVQSRAFITSVAQYADPSKIAYFPNVMYRLEQQGADPVPAELRQLMAQKFCLVFAGNLGSAQALDILLQAAEHLRDDPEICFVFLGSGSRSEWLQTQKSLLQLDNVILAGRYPQQAMPHFFASAAALIVSLNDEEVFYHTIPSKMQTYFAAGKPIIASLSGEGVRVLQEACAGLVSAAGDASALAANIRMLKAMDQAERQYMGDAGKRYFEQHFEISTQVKHLMRLLQPADTDIG